jgi:N6-L-threonylcarbamoyladenine synthase
MGLPYPGGIRVDKLAQQGNENAYRFPHPNIPGFDFSFQRTQDCIMNFVNEKSAADPDFLVKNMNDVCASYQKTIVDVLLKKLVAASVATGIRDIAISGGVSANSGLRKSLIETGSKHGWNVFIAPLEFCTDNAAMISIAGYYRYLKSEFADQWITPMARMPF